MHWNTYPSYINQNWGFITDFSQYSIKQKNGHSKTYIRVILFTLFCRDLFGFFLTFGQLFDIFGASFRHLLHQHVIRQQSTGFI